MNILVTGAPGSGKTFLVNYARKNGQQIFIDTDDVEGLCEWRKYKTGELVGPVETVNPTGGEKWYKTNGWYWNEHKLKELIDKPGDCAVCGSADNIMDFYPLFDKIVLLYKNTDDLISNLMQPGREQPNGRDPAHHARLLKWQEHLLETSQKYHPVIIVDNNIGTIFEKINRLFRD